MSSRQRRVLGLSEATFPPRRIELLFDDLLADEGFIEWDMTPEGLVIYGSEAAFRRLNRAYGFEYGNFWRLDNEE